MRALLLSALLASAGCYAPKIGDGDFQCAGMLCPQGFQCLAGRCVKNGTTVLPDLGGADAAPDLAPGGNFFGTGALGDLDLTGQSGQLDCNTETGEMRFVGGATAIVEPMQPGFELATQPGGPPIAIWNFNKLTVPAAVTIKTTTNSMRVLVFAATQELAIAGTIDLRDRGGIPGGPGAQGNGRMSGVASGGGGAMPNAVGPGGGGGGHFTMGAMGAGTGGGSGGGPYGTPALIPLHMGSGGGGGNGTAGALGGRGGSGGGAIALFGARITLAGTLFASGSPGANAGMTSPSAAGGGGGGSGGSILLSGDTVVVMVGHRLEAIGGVGGAGVMSGFAGGNGADGRIFIARTPLGNLMATPSATIDSTPVKTFPR